MADWPDSVLRRFRAVPPNPRENDFYGPWNKLLSYSYLLSTSRETADFVIKPPGNLRLPSAREEADTQIRRRIRDLSEDCLLPTLHAVSAFGTWLAFYSKAKDHQIVPGGIPPDPVLLTDTAPLDWWSCDVLEEEGRQRFRSLVTEIVQACENLEFLVECSLLNSSHLK
ncbi:hypothetical protein B0H14DRAFT_2835694 [Mycena olivaceomarginata]|nr:hypothetical protein B0H14DRAFT_2835694 [Mycena olivaceomarginata]